MGSNDFTVVEKLRLTVVDRQIHEMLKPCYDMHYWLYVALTEELSHKYENCHTPDDTVWAAGESTRTALRLLFGLTPDVCCNLVGCWLPLHLCHKINQTSLTVSSDVKAAFCSFAPEWFILSRYSPVTVCSSHLNMYYSSGRRWIIGFLKRPCCSSCLLAVLKHTICLQSQPKTRGLSAVVICVPTDKSHQHWYSPRDWACP